MPDPRVIVKALIRLNRLENELKTLGDRSKRKAELAVLIGVERAKVPLPILNHHNRIRLRGRDSTAPVRDWVCRSCFITVASGMRTHLVHGTDINVCENCGSYSYLPDGTPDYPDDTELLNAARQLVQKAEKKQKSVKVALKKKTVRAIKPKKATRKKTAC